MSRGFPVVHSMLSSDALRDFVQDQFDIGRVTQCKILNRGLNDTYIVQTEQVQYILRVYRTPWRRRTDIDYELDVLNFLSQNGVSVSSPIANLDGQYAIAVNAPEGIRHIALFTFATGTRPSLDENISYKYGKTAARIHCITDHFRSSHNRFRLDFAHLLDNPIRIFAPTMMEYSGELSYVESWARKIRERLQVEDLDFGFCHGDFHDWNVHWKDDTLTVFDFDCCGEGYRAYDLAVFLWNLKTNYKGKEDENWSSFLKGYRELRPISEVEIASIPWFVAARRIWLAGIYLSNEDVWGTGIINEQFFQSFVGQLKEDERELDLQM